MMASACDSDAKQALVFYYKTYLILLYHLKEKKNIDLCNINTDFDTINHESVFLDKQILTADSTDNDEIKELKETLNDVVIKVFI